MRKFYIIIYLVSLCFLTYCFSVVSYKYNIWPYPILSNAFQAGKAWHEKSSPKSRHNTNFYHLTKHNKCGIFKYNKQKAYNGHTLFVSGHDQKALLILMDGNIIHEWHIPFSQVWSNPPHVNLPLEDKYIGLRKAHLFPNGDLLTIYVTDQDTPYGYGFIKIDKDSKIIWKYNARAHHDLDVDSNGQIYLLTHEIRKNKVPGLRIRPPFLNDYIVILSPNGKEIKKISVLDSILNSNFSNIYTIFFLFNN